MYLHEVMNKKNKKASSINKVGSTNRGVHKCVSGTIVGPKFVSRGLTAENK